MEYKKGRLKIQSDFEIRPFMEDGPDIDLIIPLEYRTLNLYIDGMPDYFNSRIQLLGVKNILIRFSTLEDNTLCTIHFLRNIDLQSAVMNFIFDYKEHFIKLKEQEYSAEIYIERL
ncbi:MAG: hypothetical protein GX069_02235 [Tissierellia bacterium]|nr:hypothetical protein [Tissierellia bacterium]